MNRSELVNEVASKTGQGKGDVDNVLKAFQDVVVEKVTGGEKVTLQGFVSFERTERGARQGRNPSTGESIEIGPSKGVKVSAGSSFKNTVKG